MALLSHCPEHYPTNKRCLACQAAKKASTADYRRRRELGRAKRMPIPRSEAEEEAIAVLIEQLLQRELSISRLAQWCEWRVARHVQGL